MNSNPINIKTLQKKKENKEPVVLVTAYNYPVARIAEEAGCEVLLVGDSLGMVEIGYETTIPVTMEDMLVHTKAVVNGTTNSMVIADMPFLSFQQSPEKAVYNAGRFMRLGVAGVKVEGTNFIESIEAIVRSGIPVMGHIGLTPQSLNQIGGYRVMGKSPTERNELIKEAKILEEAGAFSIILESMKSETAKAIRDSVKIPVYGIGAGKFVDGQILVVNDILGLTFGIKPKFAREYINLKEKIKDALKKYHSEVKEGLYPGDEHSY